MGQVPEELVLSRLRRLEERVGVASPGGVDLSELLARLERLEALAGQFFIPVGATWEMPKLGGLEDRITETRNLAEENLLERVRQERLQRETADDLANETILTEIAARVEGDSDLSALILTEELARIEADGTITAQIVSEIEARESGDNALSASIVSEESARIAADNSLTSSITSEVAARISGDSDLAAQVDTEQTARISADGVIQASLDSEVSARIAGDNGVAALVSSEAVARAAADGQLAAEYVLSVVTGGTSGRRVAGFRITNLGGAGGFTEFVVQADKFGVVDTSGNGEVNPFVIVGGVTYINTAMIQNASITNAMIANLAANKISAGELVSMSLRAGKLATDFEVYNVADSSRTFPVVAITSDDVGGLSISSTVPDHPDQYVATSESLIFEGWTRGSTGFSTSRFGKSSMRFDLTINGNANPSGSGQLVFGPAYRTRSNGGAWGSWIGGQHDNYVNTGMAGNLQYTASYDVSGLSGNMSIQFGVRFSKAPGMTGTIGAAVAVARAYNL